MHRAEAERDELRAKVENQEERLRVSKNSDNLANECISGLMRSSNGHRDERDAAQAKLAIAVKALASIHEDGPRFLFAVPLDPTKFINEMARVKDQARRALDEIGGGK